MIALGVGLTTFAPAMVWGGARRFNDLPTPVPVIAAGFAFWLVAVAFPFGLDNEKWSNLASFVSWFVFLPAAVWALWQNRSEQLLARWPLMVFFSLHSLVFMAAGYEVVLGAFPYGKAPPLDSWFGIVHFETIFYAMGTSFFMVLICKERTVLGYIAAAKIDPLTGTSNRGAFFENARRLHLRCSEQGSPFSLIMFDLDRFKAINDNHGHQVGDRILRDFADTVRLSLRPNDIFGRYGGEEFIVVLPGASIETAAVIADRVRNIFAIGNEFLDGEPIKATVSAGVATASKDMPLEAVIEAADKAMYIAKRAGRNRVERAASSTPSESNGIIRIA